MVKKISTILTSKNHLETIHRYLLFFLLLVISSYGLAQDYSWSGNANDYDFFNESNWIDTSTGLSPANGSINPSQPIHFNLYLSCNVEANEAIVLNDSNTLHISNGILNAISISGGQVNINENSYINLVANIPLSNSVQIYLNSDISWLRLSNVNPNDVYTNYLSTIFVFQDIANYPDNIRLDNYYDNGTVIRIHNFDTTPLKIYTLENLEGTESSLSIDQVYGGSSIPNQMNNKIRSLFLRKGYMLTLAVNEDGTGKSKVFIASEEDLELQSLPNFLVDDISFIRIIPWNWVSKKGTAGDIQGMNNTWFYRWSNHGESDLLREYTPMSWGRGGADNDEDISLYQSKYKSTHVLAFNEPDDCNGQSGQYGNMCVVDTAVAVYKNLMKTGLRLVSPACRQGAVFNWLDSFNQLAIQNDIRIDVIALHWYDWDANPLNSPNANPQNIFNRFAEYLENVYDLYGLPIWITEFNANKHRTEQVNREFMQLALPYLENLSYVERYSWFEPVSGTADYYDSQNNLTLIGDFYKNYESSASIPEAIQIGPDNLDNSVVINNYIYTCEDSDSALSIDQDQGLPNSEIRIFPNPAIDKINILSSKPIYNIEIYSINGKLIKKQLWYNYIDISSLQMGIYILKVNQYYFRFIKL